MSPWIIAAIAVGCAFALVLVLALLYFFALPKLIVHKMRTSPDPGGEMTYPPDHDTLKAKTEVIRDLSYPSKYPSNKYNLYLPAERTDKDIPLVIWVHGGGFIGGTKDGGDNVMVSLCAAGYAVASIDYAVAPEYKYPAAVRQVAEFSEHLAKIFEKYPFLSRDKIIFGGDSAGAQIAAQYVASQTSPALAKEMGIPVLLDGRIRAAVLVCGPFDLPAIRAYAQKTNKMFRRLVDIWGRAYFGKLFWYKSPFAKQTIVADHIGERFPSTFLTDGNKGSFEAQNRKLAAKLRSFHVPVEELYFDPADGDVPHEYLFHLADANAQICMASILRFLEQIRS